MSDKNIFDIIKFGAAADSEAFQTEAIQSALDACRDAGGGTVVIPAGIFLISGIRMWANTTLKLLAGAMLVGSGNCEDYPAYEIPDGVEFRTDDEMIITNLRGCKSRPEYRRAMISAYGVSNIAVIGEKNSLIDGVDCYDPNGEEGFRGPHGIFFSNCDNIIMKGYTIQNSGNFMHQLDNCKNVEMREVTSLAGHDGIHLNACSDFLIEDCIFKTGDDCIAGMDVNRLTVNNCELNTSCNIFRIGGTDIIIENCYARGPGFYPHRMTVVKNKNNILSREEGRHNTIYFLEYFSSEVYPAAEPAHGWIIKNCNIGGVDRFMHFEANNAGALHAGAPLVEVTLENLNITGILMPSLVSPDPDEPLIINIKNINSSGDLFYPEINNLILNY